MGKKTERDSYCVYVHEFPNGKKYIGQTCVAPKVRWRGGKRYYGLMRKAIDKYGWENIGHIVLVDGLDARTANIVEKSLISLLHTNDSHYGYNITEGGDGYRGVGHSEETKAALSKKAKEQWERQKAAGYKPPPITEEHRRHLSESHKGKPAWNKGKATMTQEMKDRLRIARGQYWSRRRGEYYNVGDEDNVTQDDNAET